MYTDKIRADLTIIPRNIVFEYISTRKVADIELSDVFVVWFSKTLDHWKALVSTTVPDGRYYEVTYNGVKHETYLDVYTKLENICIADLSS